MASTHRDEISRLELLYAAHPDGLVFPHLADAYRRAGRYDKAETILNAGLRKHSDYSSAHVVLGRLRLDQGKHPEAESAFRRVLQLDPQNQVALEYLGELAARQDRTEEALGFLRRLSRLKTDELLAGRVRELETQLAAGLAPSPESAEIVAASGPDPENGRNPGGPRDDAPRPDPQAADPRDTPTHRMPEPGEVVTETMAELYARQGLYERAAAVYRQLLGRQPGDTRLRSKLEQAERMLQPSTRQRLPEPADIEPQDHAPPAGTDTARAATGAPAVAPADVGAAEEGAAEAGDEAPPDRRADRPDAAVEATGAAPPDSIRGQLMGVLGWSPVAAADEPPQAEPAVGEPAAEEPVDDAPVDDEPVDDEPVDVQPADVDSPVIEPPAEGSAAGAVPAGPQADEPRAQGGADGSEDSLAPLGPGDWPSERTPWLSEPSRGPATAAEEPSGPPDGGTPDEPWSALAPPEGVDDPDPNAFRMPHRALRPGEPALPAASGSRETDASRWYGPMAAVVGAEDRQDPFEGAAPETRALIALTDLLVGLLEYRDPFFRGSSSLTRLLATKVAQEMGLSRDQQVDLALAAVLRDLGRLALGGRLVAEVRIKPTAEARRKIERHVDLALQLLEGIDLPDDVRLAVRHHHERWDGAGYPDGLSGEDTPLLARILAVVDSFAAMVSPRPYRLPRKVPEAAQELQDESGTRYDPTVVDALLRVLVRREQPHLGFVQRHHILIVNPDQPGALVSATKLSSAGYLAEAAADIRTARERLRRVPVAALVISAEAGPESTTAFVRDLRLDPLFAALPIVVTDARDVETRVKLLENGADVCFPPGLGYSELQGTLGALVRRTIRSRVRQAPTTEEQGKEEAPWLALQGDIQDFPLTWLLQVMKYDSRTAAIGIRTREDDGAVYLENGDAVHAEIRHGARGEAALRRMLQWRKGRFTVQPEARPEEQTITTSIMHLLLTQAVDEDHAAAGVFGAVSAET